MKYEKAFLVKKLAKELFKWCDDYEVTGIELNSFEEDAFCALAAENYDAKYMASVLIKDCGYSPDYDDELIAICERCLK